MTQPGEIDGNEETNDSQENSRDDAQSDCSEMVGFGSLISFEVIFQAQPSKTGSVQHNGRTCKCIKSGQGEGGGRS